MTNTTLRLAARPLGWRGLALAGMLVLVPAQMAQAQTPPAAADQPAQAVPATPVPTITIPAPTQPAPSQPGGPPAAGAQAQPDSTPPAANPNFAQELVLAPRPMVYLKGTSNWDEAFDKLVAAFRQVNAYVAANGLKPSGLPFTIYTSTDDTGFEFEAAIPLAEAPKAKPKMPIQSGESPSGRALRFTHVGSYEDMDSLYEAITNYLDEKALDARESFVEEYETDPTRTPGTDLVVNIYVLLK